MRAAGLCAETPVSCPSGATPALTANPYRASTFLSRVHGVSVLLVVPQCVVWTYSLTWLVQERDWSPAAAGGPAVNLGDFYLRAHEVVRAVPGVTNYYATTCRECASASTRQVVSRSGTFTGTWATPSASVGLHRVAAELVAQRGEGLGQARPVAAANAQDHRRHQRFSHQ